MKILMIDICYNEMTLLPYKYKHCLVNNIDLFILDNMSNDGSSEFLKSNNISHSSVDTNGSFDLIFLQQAVTEKLHELKPDWFIYGAGIDMFYEEKEGLRTAIEKSDAEGFTQIEMLLRQIPDIGEEKKSGNPFCNHLYISKQTEYERTKDYNKRIFISKYSESIKITPGSILRDYINVKYTGIIFEMHACKTKQERMETFLRRKKAWDNGLDKELGWHYQAGMEHNFLFDKESCINIEELPEEFLLYKRLQQL